MTDLPEAITWGTTVNNLQLGVRAVGNLIELYLRNTGDSTLTVASHVLANPIHLDWYTLRLTTAAGQTRLIRLLDDRDESALITADLQPGAWLQHSIDLPRWATRTINGARSLEPGDYQVWVIYTVPAEEQTDDPLWIGQLEAGPVTYTSML